MSEQGAAAGAEAGLRERVLSYPVGPDQLPLWIVLRQLMEAVEHSLGRHGCDREGHEDDRRAADLARELLGERVRTTGREWGRVELGTGEASGGTGSAG